MKDLNRTSAQAAGNSPGGPPDHALELRAVSKRFGRTEVIRGVNLGIHSGECHALIGPNGAGKSTLFNLISARIPLSEGEVKLAGRRIDGLAPHQVSRLGLARSFQINNLFPRLSVFDNVACALLWLHGLGHSFWRSFARSRVVNERAWQVLEEIGLTARAQLPAGALSYAEQRALEIGLTMAAGAEVILLDEPTAGMSRSETQRAVELIRRIAQGRTLVMVEHDMEVVFGLADRISVLVHGAVVATGTPQAIRNDAAVQQAYLGRLVEAQHA